MPKPEPGSRQAGRRKLPAKPARAAALQAGRVLPMLKACYPDAHCALNYRNPFELLVATILSAQCTDERVNQVTVGLFQKYPDPSAFAAAELAELEAAVRPTGFYRNKAAAIKGAAIQILTRHGGQVPNHMAALTALPGVGRKTASVVMGNAYGKAEGVVVDTHVGRLSRRLGLSAAESPEKVEQDLMALIPAADWVIFPHLMIAHGRACCKARKPDCPACPLQAICPSAALAEPGPRAPKAGKSSGSRLKRAARPARKAD